MGNRPRLLHNGKRECEESISYGLRSLFRAHLAHRQSICNNIPPRPPASPLGLIGIDINVLPLTLLWILIVGEGELLTLSPPLYRSSVDDNGCGAVEYLRINVHWCTLWPRRE